MGFFSDLCGAAQNFLEQKQGEYGKIRQRLENCSDDKLIYIVKHEGVTMTKLAAANILKDRGYTSEDIYSR